MLRLVKALQQISVAGLNSRTPSLYVEIAYAHDRSTRRRPLLKEACQSIYGADTPRRDFALIAQEALTHPAATEALVLAVLGNVWSATDAKLVYCIGIADRLSEHGLRKECCRYNRNGENQATTRTSMPLFNASLMKQNRGGAFDLGQYQSPGGRFGGGLAHKACAGGNAAPFEIARSGKDSLTTNLA